MPDANTVPAAVVSGETVVIEDSNKALRRIFIALGISALSAVAKVVALALPDIGEALLASLPWLAIAAPLVRIGIEGGQAWILNKAATQHKEAVAIALEIPPSTDKQVENYYKQ